MGTQMQTCLVNRDINTRKSIYEYPMIFVGGSCLLAIETSKCVALSTTHAKYIVTIEVCKEVLWLKKFQHELALV